MRTGRQPSGRIEVTWKACAIAIAIPGEKTCWALSARRSGLLSASNCPSNGSSPFPDLQPFPFWFGFAILSVKQGDEIFSLFYVLWDCVPQTQIERILAILKAANALAV